MVKIYGIPNCDIVKKTLDWFKQKKIVYQFHNFKTNKISGAKLLEWINIAGVDAVVNKRSTTWRNLSQENQQKMQDTKQAIEIIMVEPSIIKRPVIESEKGLVIGFDELEYKSKFGS